ncbi:MAG: AzlC family ABC transporter permease [Pseudobdellovibrio sp.]|nr:AzlC family ABC transporter permease [Pseudobdellovibrio sp.]
MSQFRRGFKSMLPIAPGIIPFGAVMGTVSADAHMSFFQTVSMNAIVFAGASQIAAVELMKYQAAIWVVVATGLIINLRFLLYSAALSPVVQQEPFAKKLFSAFCVTDQSYAVMSAKQDKFRTNHEAVEFYIGSCVCMLIVWHSSVMAGYVFGNFAPKSISLDYAIPLSFVALLIPTLKNHKYILVAIFSSVVSLLLNDLPYRTGLMATALLGIAVAYFLTRKKGDA